MSDSLEPIGKWLGNSKHTSTYTSTEYRPNKSIVWPVQKGMLGEVRWLNRQRWLPPSLRTRVQSQNRLQWVVLTCILLSMSMNTQTHKNKCKNRGGAGRGGRGAGRCLVLSFNFSQGLFLSCDRERRRADPCDVCWNWIQRCYPSERLQSQGDIKA